jgi:Uma2 family endonuclease
MTIVETLETTSTQLPLTHSVAELFPRQGEWHEHHYWSLPESNRIIELSDGKLVMPPMPTIEHQRIVGNIFILLSAYVKANSLGMVAIAPVPVRLWPGKIREPDVMVVLPEHLERVQEQFLHPPDLVVEVLSPSTKETDLKEKYREYAQAGIAEYWIVDPESRSVAVYRLDEEQYTLAGEYRGADQIESRVLAGFVLPVAQVFEEN